jgi:tight adherence protein C
MTANLLLVAVLAAVSAGLLVVFVAQVGRSHSPEVARQLAALRRVGESHRWASSRKARIERLTVLLRGVGERVAGHRHDFESVRAVLAQAGFLHPDAVLVYWGARFGLAAVLAFLGFVILPLSTGTASSAVLGSLWASALGWVLPAFYVGRRVRARQSEIQRALPDALDMLVVCVEAGLGLNQALVRVSEELARVSPVLSDQLIMVNLEMRAGTGREEALRRLADRTGVPEVSSLVSMLIQTDRFGTSVAHAMRVQASSLRTKRRQRAEEASAKTAVKLVFPLVIFIFPALFVIILAPAMIQIFSTLGGVGGAPRLP